MALSGMVLSVLLSMSSRQSMTSVPISLASEGCRVIDAFTILFLLFAAIVNLERGPKSS